MKAFKRFRDPVHGYIDVPADLCDYFIDTPIFQRLRHIEQPSARMLFPSARHDRFSHSIGVYHLAKLASKNIIKNDEHKGYLKGIDLKPIIQAFEIASLMHDCAHAPFSHTFEEYYNKEKQAEDLLLSLVDEDFKTDFSKNLKPVTAEHEFASASILLREYKDILRDKFGDLNPSLIARMITGIVHQPVDNKQKEIENCFIRLLNGCPLDVDKLDYILRDSWACGLNFNFIDLIRLLSALTINHWELPVDRKILGEHLTILP
jgi:HD superfamily phosphohydrolase